MSAENLFLYAALAVGVVVLLWSVASAIAPQGLQNTPQNYQNLVAAENPEDICAVPPGYDSQQWREHMSHHPDKYAQCLGR